MPFYVGTGCFPAAISDSRINRIARSDTPAEMSIWEKTKEFFCSTNKSEALECIRKICHPPGGTTREDVVNRFEQLRTLAYFGLEENIQLGRHGENHFCILDADSRMMLSVTLDDDGKYTVKCKGHNETHNLTIDTELGEEGACGTIRISHAIAPTTPQTVEDYEAVWSAWKRAAPPEEATDRADVVQQLSDCLNRKSKELNFFGLIISSLPDYLPLCIKHIQISHLSLTSLPELPHGLQSLSVQGTSLTSLPKLPVRLTMLTVSNTPLTSLPELPHGLKWMSIYNTSLTSLPELPHGLSRLTVSKTPLTNLPELPASLKRLIVSDTSLTSLPELPVRLKSMSIYNTPLTSLPELPVRLESMVIYNTTLTSLPESIASLPSNVRVRLLNNPLSERTLRSLRDMTSAPDYSGPVIVFNMGGPSAPQETRPLHQAVADWLTAANERERESSLADRWQVFGEEDNAASFSSFLDRLSDTANCKKDPHFKAQISSWLAQLVQDDELRAKTFSMAMDATSSCEDRVTLALNQMKNEQLVHNAEKGEYDNKLPELVSVGREMFRLEKLEQIARDKVKTLRFIDEIEVYLGYQNKLKEPLELTSVTAEMRFFDVSSITESDLQAAELQVKAAENSEFRAWILQWEPLRSVLKRTESARWETISEKKISDYDDIYRTLFDTELKPAGLVGNTDAERTIGARAMECAEKVFLDGLRPLVDEILGSYLKFRGPN
ncbi:NEL-type E3 ubiquitin ligase domain-containing protein [Enterobacter ludwigii]